MPVVYPVLRFPGAGNLKDFQVEGNLHNKPADHSWEKIYWNKHSKDLQINRNGGVYREGNKKSQYIP